MLFSKFIFSFHIISYIINLVCSFIFIFEFEQDGRRTSKHQPSSPPEVEQVLNKINQLQKKMADRKSLKFNASEMGGIQSIWPFNLGACFYVQEWRRNTDFYYFTSFGQVPKQSPM
jgi:NADH:ubiquinone oxidoreductase subunit B-like Fe-S oxidoreductase